ncbi:EamA domain-containing protein [Cephalotus follicularis]|uniref:WAT1-related protein n=1 Tax=Cephalotus follicularis TaxID=3775 RepID=A0A1Q3CWB8_CEPFO|nr:EamA domain-containing protein [Cephalotus follicularis]
MGLAMDVRKICNLLHGLKAAMLMVVVQILFAGVNIFYKLAENDGMNLKIIVAYRFIFATVFMTPIALVVERKSRPKLTWTVIFQAFLSGLLGGAITQNLYLEGMALTSATFASAINNLNPAITFVIALAFGMEKLALRTLSGKAKVLGTLTGIGGAMLLTFYKGVQINIWSTHVDLLKHDHPHGGHVATHTGNPGLGTIFLVASCSSFALWLIVQTKMSLNYPCQYSSTVLMSLMGSIQSSVFAFCVERDWSQWKLGWNIRLFTVVYTGISSGLMITMMAWCMRMRGPLFVSVFNPLMLVLVAIAGSLVLNEKLHLGSVLGAVLIVCGLYMVLWGKSKDMKKITQLVPSIVIPESHTIELVVNDQNNDNNIIGKIERDSSGEENGKK